MTSGSVYLTTLPSSSSSSSSSSSLDVSKDTQEVYNFLREKYLEVHYPNENPLKRPFMHGAADRSFYFQWYKDSISSSSKSASSSFFASSSSSKSASASQYPLHRMSIPSNSSTSTSSCSSVKIKKLDLREFTETEVNHICKVWMRVNSSSSITQQFVSLDMSMVPYVKLEKKINELQTEFNKELRNSSCLSTSFLWYYLGFGPLAQKERDLNDLENFKNRILARILGIKLTN